MSKKTNSAARTAGAEAAKWLISLLVSAALLLACVCLYDNASAKPQGEVFTGKAQGMMCEIVAEVTVADGKIVDVKLTGADETPALGGKVLEEMPAKILAAQSTDVDGMTGATVTTEAVKAAVNEALAQAGLMPAPEVTEEPTEKETEVPTEEATEASTEAPTEEETEAPTEAETEAAGEVFTGKAQGMMCEIVAEVTVTDGKIVDVKLTGPDETPTLGGKVLEEMPAKIVAAQSADVDGMTGATVTTEAVKAAVKEALTKAGLL